VASRGTITWSVNIRRARSSCAFSIMLVEGAIADWSAIYLRTSVLTGPGIGRSLDMRCSQALWLGGRLTGDYLTGKLGRGHLVCYGALLAAAGLAFVLLFGNAVGRWWDYVRWSRSGHDIPNTFAAAGNIKGSAPGPSLAVVTEAGYFGFLAGPP